MKKCKFSLVTSTTIYKKPLSAVPCRCRLGFDALFCWDSSSPKIDQAYKQMRSTKHNLSVFPNQHEKICFFPFLQASLTTNYKLMRMPTSCENKDLPISSLQFHKLQVSYVSNLLPQSLQRNCNPTPYADLLWLHEPLEKRLCHESLFLTQRDCYLT